MCHGKQTGEACELTHIACVAKKQKHKRSPLCLGEWLKHEMFVFRCQNVFHTGPEKFSDV